MKKTNIISYIALALSLIALGVTVLTAPIDRTPQAAAGPVATIDQQELNRLVNEAVDRAMGEFKAELLSAVTASSADPGANTGPEATAMTLAESIAAHPGSAVVMNGILRKEIRAAVLERIADKLDDVNWQETLSTEEIEEVLKQIAKSSLSSDLGPLSYQSVDVSGFGDVSSRIARILKEFDGAVHYTHNNALVRQIADMGEPAIHPLLEALKKTQDQSQWAKRAAVTDALEELLSEEHEEIILKEVRDNGNFAHLVKKYMFPAAEKDLLDKIRTAKDDKINDNVVDAAIMMNPEKAIPLLLDFVSTGQNVSHASKKLATIQGVDLVEPLRSATKNAKTPWEKSTLVELCLERGMSEGFDMAIPILASVEVHTEHRKQQVSDQIRRYTGVTGSYKDVADWLEKNGHTLKWSPEMKMFKPVK